MLLRAVSYSNKQRCSSLEWFFVSEMEQKQAIWCLKCKSLDISALFIELLYKINITFVTVLIFWRKNWIFCVILFIWNVNKYIFGPISWILQSLLMHFNRLNHAVKEHALNVHVHCLTPSSPQANVCMPPPRNVAVLFGFCKILDIVKLHIVKTTITILSQTIYIAHPYY